MEENPVTGFHHGCEASLNNGLLDHMMTKTLFPNYGFSFYENPPGRVIRKGRDDTPSLFLSDRLVNLGDGSFVKILESQDVFTDYGLSLYRNVSFLMFLGESDQLVKDIQCLLGHARHCFNHPLLGFFDEVLGKNPENRTGCHDIIQENLAILDEVHAMEYDHDSGYGDCAYLTSNMKTSLELSHVTIRNIIESSGRGFTELVQVPVLQPEYDHMLSNVFHFEESHSHRLAWGKRSYPICGIVPGIFAYDGVICDVARRIVSGKRKDLVRFILMLRKENILDERDLRYLV